MMPNVLAWIRARTTASFLLRRSRFGRALAGIGGILHFRFGRLTYTQRERLDAARLGSQSIWVLLRWATVPLVLAILALVLFGIGPFLYDGLASRFHLPVLIRFPPVDPQSFSGVVGTTAQATAAVLALFFAAISVVASTAYAKITTEIRALVAQDPLNRRYLRLLAHVTATALGAGAMQSAGYVPSAALLWYVLGLAGVCMVAFLPLGIRTFALFDPDSLAIYPIRTFSRAMGSVGVSGHRWLDPSFQNHANRTASSQLDALEDLVVYSIAEERSRNDAVVGLIRQILRLGAYYSTQKHKIPSDSLWFAKKTEFRRWETSDSTATELALQTGGTPAPEQVPDFSFVESRIAGMLRTCLEHLLKQNALEDAAAVILDVSRTSTAYAKHFQQAESMQCTEAVRAVLLERLKTARQAPDSLKDLQLVDAIGYTALAPILHTPLAITQIPVDDLVKVASSVLRLNRKAIHDVPRPRKVIQDAEDLLNRLSFEQRAEKRIRTRLWYSSQIIALAWATYIRDAIKSLALVVERDLVAPANELVTANRALAAAVWLQRGIEGCHKAKHQIEALERTYEELKRYQVAELRWEPSGSDVALTRIEEHRVAVVRLLATIVPQLVALPTDRSLPDVVGPARAWIGDELVSMMGSKQEAGFRELFGAYFAATLATHDYLFRQMRESGREYYAYVAMDTLLDVMDISGLALLYSELDATRFSQHVTATWDLFLSRTADVPATIQTSFLAIDARFDGPMFSASAMRRQEWGNRFGAALENRGIDTDERFDPFSRRRMRPRHGSPVIESISVLYGHPMTEAHDYFAALYLVRRTEANGLTVPRAVRDVLRSIELAHERAENAKDEAPEPTEEA